MLTYKALIDDATQQLWHTSDTPRIDCEVLMQHVLQKDMAWLIAYGETKATAEHTKEFYTLVASRVSGQPIAYLIGFRDFWTLRLKVNQNVLIPRADTETLVEEALECLPKNQALRVLDLGTGSGAIALSIAKERPHAQIVALEYHQGALEVAKENALFNNINNIEFRLSDWFDKIACSEKFDLIASNPPYVEPGDPHLDQGDLRFEPITALTALEDGMADIQNIIRNAPKHLEEDGILIVEHGYNQADSVAALFTQNKFKDIELYKDINGLDRCTKGKLAATQ
jgi:release factor glutamine methyltransferase